MTSETVAEAEWLLKGYWTKLRYPFQTSKGGWSDIDILSYHPEKRHLVISESKVRGPKDHVFAYTKNSEKEYGHFFKYDNDSYLSFLRHIPQICSSNLVFNDFPKMVNILTIQLISNYFISTDIIQDVQNQIKQRIKKHIPQGITIEIQMDTTLDVIERIIRFERNTGQGRRYGHPVLDIAREINRYFLPKIRYAGRNKKEIEKIKEELTRKFKKTLGI
jgi:hypothetical protein